MRNKVIKITQGIRLGVRRRPPVHENSALIKVTPADYIWTRCRVCFRTYQQGLNPRWGNKEFTHVCCWGSRK